MSGQIPTPIGSIALGATLLVCGVGVIVPTNFARADDCLTAPNSPAPEGSHWYYQTDRATQRKCWYLRAPGQATQPATRPISEAAPTAAAPMSISPKDSAPRDERVQQSKEGSTAPSNPEASAPQAGTSLQSIAQTAAPRPDVGIGVPTNMARADKCRTAPNSPAPEGSHWYYQTDRTTQRKCWYLRALAQPTQPATRPTSEAAPATQPNAFKKSSTPARAPMSTSPGHNAPSLKSQLAPMRGATMNEPVQQNAREGSTGPSIPEASPPQASTSSQTSAQAAGLAQAPPAITMLKVRRTNLFPSDRNVDSVQSRVDARAPDNAESSARGSASTTNATGIATSLVGTTGATIKMALIIALGLVAAGLLYRVVMKIVAVRRRQINVEHLESGWIDNRNQHESRGDKWQHRRSLNERDELIDDLHPSRRDNRQQHRSSDEPHERVDDLHPSWRDERQQPRFSDERDKLIDDLHRSLMLGTSDYSAGRAFQVDGEWPNSARRTGGSFQVASEVSEREDKLEQWRRDLDWLLQSSKAV
jgi:hypothetical protein